MNRGAGLPVNDRCGGRLCAWTWGLVDDLVVEGLTIRAPVSASGGVACFDVFDGVEDCFDGDVDGFAEGAGVVDGEAGSVGGGEGWHCGGLSVGFPLQRGFLLT